MSTRSTIPVRSKLPDTGVTIFTTMSRLALEHGAINLSQGFPDFNCAPELIDAVARYMREGHNQYAPMPGTIPLREALAMKIERLYGHRYDPVSEITITSGATEALFATLTALVHPGDEVLLFQPAYDSYVPAIQLSGGTPVFVTLRPPCASCSGCSSRPTLWWCPTKPTNTSCSTARGTKACRAIRRLRSARS
jgi:methionine aminotransferase